jgi:AcrR family transcriptional regulator
MTVAGEETRGALHKAAVELFAKRGFHGVTLAEVARAAGIGAATVYRHTESKEALINVVLRALRQALDERLWSDSLDPAESVEHVFKLTWLRLATHGEYRPDELILLELRQHDGYLEPATARVLKPSILAPLVPVLERGQREGLIRSEKAEYLAELVKGLFLASFKLGLEHGRGGLVNAAPMDDGRDVAWSALQA